MDDDELQLLIQNNSKVRRLFFGRKDVTENSLFEKIFMSPIYGTAVSYKILKKLINHVWKTFEFKDNPLIFTLVSLIFFSFLIQSH